MLEYVFFDRRPFDRFCAFVSERGVACEMHEENEILEARLPEDLPDELLDPIEAFYDEMLDLNQKLYDSEQSDENGQHTAGVVVNLKNGVTAYANVNPLLLGKIMEVLTPEEFGDVVNAIVDAVELPDERPLCKR